MKQLQFLKSKDGFDKESVISWFSVSLDSIRNGLYDITIAKHQTQRSTPQNRILHFWFRCISDETGETFDRVKAYYKEMYCPRHVMTFNGNSYSIIPSTRDLTTEEMTTFLNAIQADAETELGIRLPNADDKYFAEFAEMYG